MTTIDPRTADGMTDTEVIDFVREALGEPVAKAAKAVLDAIGPATSDIREKLTLTRVDHSSWQSVNHVKKTFEEACEEQKTANSSEDVEVLEVMVVRKAKVTRTISSSVVVE